MKRLIQVSLAVLMLAALTCVAYARYSYIGRFGLAGSIGSTSVSSTVNVQLNERLDSKVVVKLERSSDNGGSFQPYSTLKTYTSSSDRYNFDVNKSGLSSAYDYRLKAELYVYDDYGYEIDYNCTYLE